MERTLPSQQQNESSSSNMRNDVFLEFRGTGTRSNFTDHLCHALNQKGVSVHLTVDQRRSSKAVIKNSRFAVVVFSANYVNSDRCLNRLVDIVRCKKLAGMEVIPVFHHVEPSAVRLQAELFSKQVLDRKSSRHDRDIKKVDKWRTALNEIETFAGWHVTPNRSEADVVQRIVDKIIEKLYNNLSDPKLVGIDARVKEIESCLELKSNDVLTVGIWGMGGVGKTTLADEVFKKIINQFDPGYRFKFEVALLSAVELLQCLCESLLGISNIKIDNVENGLELLKKALSRKKVLIFLDDVVSFKQIECLALQGTLGHNIWGAGSRLIITTRDRSSLTRDPGADETYLYEFEKLRVYEVEKLRDEEALQLLCQTAFKDGIPPVEFEASSESLLRYAGGIPLAHKVLGSYLSKVKVDCWSEILERLDDERNKEIFGVLEVSYDGLLEADKNIFLDIGCFFYDENLVRVQNILSGFDYACSPNSIRTLVNKSLIKIEKGKLQMHNLLRCLCWHIVREENKEEPGKRSRLWVDDNTPKYGGRNSWRFEDARDVLMDNVGTNVVKGLVLNLHEKEEMSLEDDPFLKMSSLQLLKLYNVDFQDVHLDHVSSHLRILEWHEYPLQSLPDDFKWVNLIEIKMPNSRIEQLWNDKVSLEMLMFMDFSNCEYLMMTPDFSTVPNLEQLILQGCNKLSELHHTIGDLQKLKVLNLKRCTSLQSLPQSISMTSLEVFILSGCSKLREFPEIWGSMNNLSELYLDDTGIQEIPDSVKHVKGIILVQHELKDG